MCVIIIKPENLQITYDTIKSVMIVTHMDLE